MAKEIPSIDQWLREAKAHESAPKIGMYLTHNGTVRQTAKAKARLGLDVPDVKGMYFTYDQAKVDAAVQKLLNTSFADAVKLLTDNRSLLDEIAEYLLVKETITGDELMAFVNADQKQLPEPAEEATEE